MVLICYPKCSTCKKAQQWLEEHNIPYTYRDIKQDRPNRDEIENWHKVSALPFKRFFNTSGQLYRALGLKDKLQAMPYEEQLDLIASDGMLVKRPLLIGDGFVLAGFNQAQWEAQLTPAQNGQDWHIRYRKNTEPQDQQIASYIQNALWQELNDTISKTYALLPKKAYSGCGMQPGWNIKYQKGGKSLCTLYPMSGYFIALIVIGRKEMPEAELLIGSCTPYVQNVFKETKIGMGQKWLMIDVKAHETITDIMRLIALRAAP